MRHLEGEGRGRDLPCTKHTEKGGRVYKIGAQGQGKLLSTPSPSFPTPSPTPTPPPVKLSPFLPCRIPKRSGRPGPGPAARTRWIQSPLAAELIIREWGTGSVEGGREGGRTRCGRPAGGCAGPHPRRGLRRRAGRGASAKPSPGSGRFSLCSVIPVRLPAIRPGPNPSPAQHHPPLAVIYIRD